MIESREIPNGWELVKLSEIISDLQSGKRPKGGVQGIESGVPSIGGEHLNDEGEFKFGKIKFVPIDFAKLMTKGVIQAKDIIVVKDGATTGKTSFVKTNFPFKYAVINEHVFILRLLKEVLPEFAFYRIWSQAGKNEILEDFRGAAQGGISSSFINYVNIPLPPLPEQHRIVAKIEELYSTLAKGIESLKTAQQQLKIYRQAVLKWAFEGKLTNKNVVEGELPQGWEKVKFGTVFSESPQNGLYKSSTNYGSGTRIVRIDGFYEGKLLFDYEYKKVRLTQDEIKRYRISEGDILINRVNSLSHLGKCGFVEQLKEETVFESNIMKIIVDRSIADAKYISIFLSSIEGLTELRKNAKHAVNQASINQKDVSNVLIPLAPYCEQQAIVAEIESRLSICDKIEESIENSLKQAESLRQSILKKAFEGKLVTQDPNDEPASVLLTRIKAERERNKTGGTANTPDKKNKNEKGAVMRTETKMIHRTPSPQSPPLKGGEGIRRGRKIRENGHPMDREIRFQILKDLPVD